MLILFRDVLSGILSGVGVIILTNLFKKRKPVPIVIISEKRKGGSRPKRHS